MEVENKTGSLPVFYNSKDLDENVGNATFEIKEGVMYMDIELLKDIIAVDFYTKQTPMGVSAEVMDIVMRDPARSHH